MKEMCRGTDDGGGSKRDTCEGGKCVVVGMMREKAKEEVVKGEMCCGRDDGKGEGWSKW